MKGIERRNVAVRYILYMVVTAAAAATGLLLRCAFVTGAFRQAYALPDQLRALHAHSRRQAQSAQSGSPLHNFCLAPSGGIGFDAARTEFVDELDTHCCGPAARMGGAGGHRRSVQQQQCDRSRCSAACAAVLLPAPAGCRASLAELLDERGYPAGFLASCSVAPLPCTDDPDGGLEATIGASPGTPSQPTSPPWEG